MTPSANRRGLLSVVLAGAALALTAAACGSGSTTTTPAASATAASKGGGTPANGGHLTATLTEFHIAMSTTSFPAGTYTIAIRNAGTTLHAFDVVGTGGMVASSDPVLPGQSTTVTATLAAGKYHVYCPIDDHRSEGMDTVLTVGPGSVSTSPAST